jgi:hypothetical protein
MTTNISENKWIEYSSSEAHVSLNGLTMLEETEKMVLQLRKPAIGDDPVVNTTQEQKLPDFYELKIRVRKYDFL